MDDLVLKNLGKELRQELTSNIIPYWTKTIIDQKHGGFAGRITYENKVDYDAPRGAIMNARLLWAYSACYRQFKRKILKELADRAYIYITKNFWDGQYGGVYWMLDAKGQVIDDRKHIYVQSFTIYALAEYYMAFGCERALDVSNDLYNLIESRSADSANGGYFEAFSRDWQLHEDSRLSEKDINVPKSMNTHLHLLEAYTNLYRCKKSRDLKRKLISLINVFLKHIVADDGTHLVNFLDDDWTPKSNTISFGHDIESAWLLPEAAEVIHDERLREKIMQSAVNVTAHVLKNGVNDDGGLMTEADFNGVTNDDKEWWPQAEALVGFLNAYEYTRDDSFLSAALDVWEFIKKYMIDYRFGDWHARVDRRGIPYGDDKVCDWKCNYHNSRACIEVMRRTDRLARETNSMIRPSVKSS